MYVYAKQHIQQNQCAVWIVYVYLTLQMQCPISLIFIILYLTSSTRSIHCLIVLRFIRVYQCSLFCFYSSMFRLFVKTRLHVSTLISASTCTASLLSQGHVFPFHWRHDYTCSESAYTYTRLYVYTCTVSALASSNRDSFWSSNANNFSRCSPLNSACKNVKKQRQSLLLRHRDVTFRLV